MMMRHTIANTETIATINNYIGCNEQQFDLGMTDENGSHQIRRCPYGQWTVFAGPGELLVDVTTERIGPTPRTPGGWLMTMTERPNDAGISPSRCWFMVSILGTVWGSSRRV